MEAKQPEWITIKGVHYKLTVFKIHNHYENGDPEDCTLIPDEQIVEITGGEKFMIVYVRKDMLPSLEGKKK